MYMHQNQFQRLKYFLKSSKVRQYLMVLVIFLLYVIHASQVPLKSTLLWWCRCSSANAKLVKQIAILQ